ncbi:hypothetical protein DL96DRAFT_1705254 [Flagelloscypha sp. PMI_526]|nr:hypothetical protein DL96DRAFT_1705254 [Flagelloscypha sp. PMI_526]
MSTFEEPQQVHRRDSNYYFDGSPKVILVEDRLFRVPMQLLVLHSRFFADMFSLPTGQGNIAEGDTDADPIVIQDELAETFSNALAWLYRDPSFTVRDKTEWINLLQFSHKFQMQSLFTTVVDALREFTLDPFEKISLCDRFDIPIDWAFDAMKTVCTRKEPLKVAEIDNITKSTFCIIVFVREKLAKAGDMLGIWCVGHSTYNCSCAASTRDEDIRKWIREAQSVRGQENPEDSDMHSSPADPMQVGNDTVLLDLLSGPVNSSSSRPGSYWPIRGAASRARTQTVGVLGARGGGHSTPSGLAGRSATRGLGGWGVV